MVHMTKIKRDAWRKLANDIVNASNAYLHRTKADNEFELAKEVVRAGRAFCHAITAPELLELLNDCDALDVIRGAPQDLS